MAQEFIRPTPYASCDEENMGKCNSFDRIGDSQHEFIRIDLQDDIHYLRTGDIAKVIFDCTTMYGQGFVLRDEYLKNYDPVTHNVSFYVRIPERGDEMVRRNGESVLINKDALFERGSSGGSGEIGETEIGGEAESKNNESKSNSLEQLVNMGIPIEEASELLESVDGNVEIAAELFYSGSTPRKGGGGEQKSDDIDDEDGEYEEGEYITGEAIKIKSLYKSITLEEAKGIVLKAEIEADDILKDLPDYTDNFNDVYQSFIVELAMNLVKSKMSTDAGDETDDEEDVSLEDLASAAYAAEKALQKKIEIKGGGEKKSMEIMEQSVASGVGRYALKDAVLSMDPRGDMISALSAKISYIEEEVDWARGVREPEIEPYIREFTNAAFAYLKRQMRDYFSDHSKAHRPMLRASSSDMPRVSVLLRGASTGRSSEEIERLKESIHHKIRELERKQQRNEEPQNKTINSQVKKLKSDLARLEMDLETTKADLKR